MELCLKQEAGFEGFKNEPYCDQCGHAVRKFPRGWLCDCDDAGKPPGNLTIGYGRNLYDRGITMTEGEFLLRAEVDDAIQYLSGAPWWKGLSGARQACLIGMFRNLGQPKFLGFKKMLEDVGNQDYQFAAQEILESDAAKELADRYYYYARLMRTGRFGEDEA
jgi:lysozyme